MVESAGVGLAPLQDADSAEGLCRQEPRRLARARPAVSGADAVVGRAWLRWSPLAGRNDLSFLLRHPRRVLQPERLHVEVLVADLDQLAVRLLQRLGHRLFPRGRFRRITARYREMTIASRRFVVGVKNRRDLS